MTANVRLLTPERALEQLCQLCDATRRSTVKVDREALNLVLIDYNVMLNALRSSYSYTVHLPEAKRERPRLTR